MFEQNTEGNSGKKFRENSVKVKLPNLIISKIQRKSLQLSFRSQFQTEIDRADIAMVGNVSYLRV